MEKKKALSDHDLELLKAVLVHVNNGKSETAMTLLQEIEGDEEDGKDQGLCEIWYMSAHLAQLAHYVMGEKGQKFIKENRQDFS